MVHKPKHKVHSFRNLLDSSAQDEINLERQNVNLAYRIVKLELMSYNMNEDVEHSIQIYTEQTDATSLYDFSNTNLIGAAFLRVIKSSTGGTNQTTVVFDNILFSRNIFITHIDVGGSAVACNYYLEIEEVPVGAATLMQIKLGVARKLNLKQEPVPT